MNFLSHYYFHHRDDDNFFTVGLTVPDLLGFHSRRVRVTKKYLENLLLFEKEKNIRSFIYGMILHLDLDRWFHNTDFFKEKLLLLQDRYVYYNEKKEKLPHFYAHILIEVLIDRYLLTIEPDIADRFYESYKKFDFKMITKLFEGLKNFDRDKFLDLAYKVSHSSFLKEYINDHLIITILGRVSKRINLPFLIDEDNEKFTQFILFVYSELELSIKKFVKKASKDLMLKKEKIINFN